MIVAATLAGCDDSSVPIAPSVVKTTPPPEAPPPEASAPSKPPESTQKAELPRIDLAGIKELIAQTAGQDRVLVIDFWATWCQPCVAMFQPLHDGVAGLGDRVRLVSVTLDADETEAAAVAFLADHHAEKDAFLLVPDSDQRMAVVDGLSKNWKDLVVPAVLVYDARGQLAADYIGDVQVEAVVEKVRSLITTQAVAPMGTIP